MKELQKQHIKNSIEKLQASLKKHKILYKLGVDLSDYESGFSNCIEEGIAILCSNSEKEFAFKLETIGWWVYDGSDKKVYDLTEKTVLHDLNHIDDFVDYLLKPIK